MTINVRPGIYLENNPPRRSQWRTRPLDRIKPVITTHTAEGGYQSSLRWIQTRTTAGSYHALGQPNEITRLIRYEHAAYHARGYNTTIGVSGAMSAADWPAMTADETRAWIDVYAFMWHDAAMWLDSIGKPVPPPVLLNRAQVDQADAAGFVSTPVSTRAGADPGPAFPWDDAFDRYVQLLGHEPTKETPMTDTATPSLTKAQVRLAQEHVRAHGFDPGPIDGIPGAKTLEAMLWFSVASAQEAQRQAGQPRPHPPPVDPELARKAALWDMAVEVWSGLRSVTAAATNN